MTGIAIGRYTAPPATPKSPQLAQSTSNWNASAPAISASPQRHASSSKEQKSTNENSELVLTSENIIAALKNALGHLGGRRTFVEFGKLSELINQDNLAEVLAF